MREMLHMWIYRIAKKINTNKFLYLLNTNLHIFNLLLTLYMIHKIYFLIDWWAYFLENNFSWV